METNKIVENWEQERQESILKSQFSLEKYIISVNNEIELLKIIASQLVELNTQIKINNL